MLATILSRYWWMTLLRGAIAVLFGMMLFAWPQMSLASLVLVFGAFAFADGVGNVVTAVGGRKEHENWWVLLLSGLAGIGIGILTLMNPAATALAILFYIAIWAIATGLLQIVAAIRLRKEIEGEFWLALAGLASVVFGVLLVARPAAGALTVLWLIASYSIVFGATLILLAFKARGWEKRVKAAVSAV
jgi:uncharacterized membrane protein HdeD (DUF308 family)